jgi:hypothetical protein
VFVADQEWRRAKERLSESLLSSTVFAFPHKSMFQGLNILQSYGAHETSAMNELNTLSELT